MVALWYGGRPFPQAADRSTVRQRLSSYGPGYRRTVQDFLWKALRSGDLGTAAAVRKLGWLLLPRIRDRIYTVLPPQITSRFGGGRP